MTPEERVRLANLGKDELLPLEMITERYLTGKLRERQANEELLNSTPGNISGIEQQMLHKWPGC